MADSNDVVQLYRRHVNIGMARLASLVGMPVEARSSGSVVVDESGRAYLDCGGYGVFIAGHCHPVVTEAVKAQLAQHPLATKSMLSRELALAAASLSGVAPKGLDYVCFGNSGAEATEIGIKIARLGGKSQLIAMDGGFHGKTLGALSVSGRLRYREPFEPLLPNVTRVGFGDADALERLVSGFGETCCVILEPIQGEAGVIVPPAGYLGDVEAICRRHGAFLMLDEIQTGLGRLGSWWGADREGVRPDIMLVGKGLSGGCVPVAAALATAQAFEPLNRDPLLHSSTFAGNPLAMAAASAAIQVIDNEGLVARSQELGARLLPAIRRSVERGCPGQIVEVRGVGLLIGIEFRAEHLAGKFALELMQRSVLSSTSLNAHKTVRFTPPAVLGPTEVDWLLGAVEESAVALGRS